MGALVSLVRKQTNIQEKIGPEEHQTEVVPFETDYAERENTPYTDDEFEDFTFGNDFDDASAGTDVRIIRILNLSQKEKNVELLNAASSGDEFECGLLLKYGASTKRLDW